MKNKIILLLFFCATLLHSQAQLFRVIYVYEEVPAFGPEVRKVLEEYRITFQKGEASQLYGNFKTYRELDSVYQTRVMKQVHRKLKNNVPWEEFTKQIMVPLNIRLEGPVNLRYEFAEIGLIKKYTYRGCISDFTQRRCNHYILTYNRSGKARKKTIKH